MDKTVHVAQNVDALLTSVVALVKELKANKPLAEVVTDELPTIIAAIGEVQGVAAELRSDLPGVLNAVVLGVSGVLALFL